MIHLDDHMKVIAGRMAEKMRSGVSEKTIFSFLTKTCRWSDAEAEAILSKAKQINERKDDDESN